MPKNNADMSKDKERGQLEELLYPIMTKRNMSVQSLASAIGVQRHTFYSWLYENRRPRLEMLRRIARVLNIPLAQLVCSIASPADCAPGQKVLTCCSFCAPRAYIISADVI